MDEIERLIAADQLEAAREQLAQARQRQPHHPQLQYLDAALAAREGRFREASAQLVELLATVPDHALGHLLQARLQHRLGHPEIAQQRFEDALALDTRLLLGSVTANEVAVLDADLPGLAKRYQEAMVGGDDPEARLALAGVLLRQGQFGLCMSELQPVLSKAQPAEAALLAVAACQAMQGKPDDAIAQLQPLSGSLVELLRIQLLQLARRWQAAVAAAEAWLGQHPDRAQGWMLLAESLLGGGIPGPAGQAANEALRLCPEHARARRILALARLRLGESAAAEQVLLDHLERHPHDHTSWRMLLAFQTRREAYGEALVQARRWLECCPEEADAQADLAALLEHEGELDAAMQAAVQALRLQGQHVNALLIGARAELRIGRPGPILAKLDRLSPSGLEPGQKDARLVLLARAADARGDHEQAVARWQERHQGAVWLRSMAPFPTVAQMPRSGRMSSLPPLDRPVAFLLGLPGSGVQHVAGSLRKHPDLRLMADRFGGPQMRQDGFSQPDWPRYADGLSEGQGMLLRRRWRKAVERGGHLTGSGMLVDWLPYFDALSHQVLAAVFPGAPVIIVERALDDCLLDWLAFPGMHRQRFDGPAAAGEWLSIAARHLQAIAVSDRSPVIRVRFEDLLEDPDTAFAGLLQALGVDPAGAQFRPERTLGDLPGFHPSGHAKAYSGALAEGFARLRP